MELLSTNIHTVDCRLDQWTSSLYGSLSLTGDERKRQEDGGDREGGGGHGQGRALGNGGGQDPWRYESYV